MAHIDYYYSAHSAFAYLGSARLLQICAHHGVTLQHKPIDLTPVVEAQGSLPFAARTQAHVDYFFGREIERWAEWRNVEVIKFRPTHHDAPYGLASGMIAALGSQGPQVDAMSHAVLEAHWRDDADLSSPEVLAALATRLGHDAQSLIARAAANQAQEQVRANTQAAMSLPVFGSPTYIYKGDAFYGQDRLEHLEHALSRPFKATNWRNPPVGRGA